jgi:Polyketide cyclase / dehydrase and lipid transport
MNSMRSSGVRNRTPDPPVQPRHSAGDSNSTVEPPATQRRYERHYAESVTVDTSAEDVFSFADDFNRLSSHMSQSSGMMMGGRMQISFDDGRGQTVGSHVRMTGRMMGFDLFLEEVVTERVPPRHKAWEIIGNPNLLVIGNYRLGFDIASKGTSSNLRIFIDYELPPSPALRWLGILLGPVYAKWCVGQMVKSARLRFAGQQSNQ